MLFLSERSWKHHYVTLLLPYSYLVGEFFSNRLGPRSRALLVGSWALAFSLMAAASADLGGLFADGQGHEIAQGVWIISLGRRRAVRDGCLAGLGKACWNPSHTRSPESPGSSIPRTHISCPWPLLGRLSPPEQEIF